MCVATRGWWALDVGNETYFWQIRTNRKKFEQHAYVKRWFSRAASRVTVDTWWKCALFLWLLWLSLIRVNGSVRSSSPSSAAQHASTLGLRACDSRVGHRATFIYRFVVRFPPFFLLMCGRLEFTKWRSPPVFIRWQTVRPSPPRFVVWVPTGSPDVSCFWCVSLWFLFDTSSYIPFLSFFFLFSGGWGKIKVELATLPRSFIHVVWQFDSIVFAVFVFVVFVLFWFDSYQLFRVCFVLFCFVLFFVFVIHCCVFPFVMFLCDNFRFSCSSSSLCLIVCSFVRTLAEFRELLDRLFSWCDLCLPANEQAFAESHRQKIQKFQVQIVQEMKRSNSARSQVRLDKTPVCY